MMRVDHERVRSRGEQIERCSKYTLHSVDLVHERSLVEGKLHSIYYSTLRDLLATSTGASRSSLVYITN